MKKCDYCGQRHWFRIPPRYWWRKALSYVRCTHPRMRRSSDLMMRNYNTVYKRNTDTVGNTGTVVTNYHKSAGKIYCHPCWPKYLREIGM